MSNGKSNEKAKENISSAPHKRIHRFYLKHSTTCVLAGDYDNTTIFEYQLDNQICSLCVKY